MRRRASSRNRQAGFTLMELLVIASILGIMMAIAVPLTMRQLVRIRAEGFANEIANLIQATRGRAIRDNAAHPVDWVDEDGDAVLDAITGVTGLGSEASQAVRLSLVERGLEIYSDPLDPTDPCFAATKYDKSHQPAPLTYDGTGTADVEAAFCYQDTNGNVLQVAVDSTAGAPKIRKLVAATGKFSPDTWEWEWY